jgi:hypothetical protein
MSKQEFSKISLIRLVQLEGESVLIGEAIDSEKQVEKISENIKESEFNFLLSICPNGELVGLLRYFSERYQEQNIVKIIIKEEGKREKIYSKIMWEKKKQMENFFGKILYRNRDLIKNIELTEKKQEIRGLFRYFKEL